jgi:DNA-binding NarL/FixJ family response regulator
VAGLLFVRDAESPPFGRREARLLGEMHPFLELTFDLSSAPLVAPRLEVPGSADLTSREAQIAELVASGASNADIAAALRVSEATVKTHVGRLLAKLDQRDRVQLAVLAYETGLVRAGH